MTTKKFVARLVAMFLFIQGLSTLVLAMIFCEDLKYILQILPVDCLISLIFAFLWAVGPMRSK